MIYSKMEELNRFVPTDIYSQIKKFVDNINSSTHTGLYHIVDDIVFARVLEYDTLIPDDCKIETHRRYIDIQSSICGAEGITIFDIKPTKGSENYDVNSDVEFHDRILCNVLAHIHNIPGYFTMLYPGEPHRPQENVAGYGWVKKFVIKIDYDEFNAHFIKGTVQSDLAHYFR